MEFELHTQGLGILLMILLTFVSFKYKKYKLLWAYPVVFLLIYVYNPVKTTVPDSSYMEYNKDFSIPEKEFSNELTLGQQQQKFLETVEKHNESK